MLAAIITPSRMGIITSFSTVTAYCGRLRLSAGKSAGNMVCMISGCSVFEYMGRSSSDGTSDSATQGARPHVTVLAAGLPSSV